MYTVVVIERPVARLAASGDELVGIEDHDLVFVGLVYEDAMYGRCISRYYRETIAY